MPMRFFRCGLVALLSWSALALANTAWSATYYVRTDGGTNAQCTGKADAAFTGKSHACAWASLFEALPPRFDNVPNPAHIKGGDTVIIEAGSYRMGWTKGYQPRWGDPCDGRYAPGCDVQPIPSGAASQPTRILGAGWDRGCTSPPELWGTEGSNHVLSLDGSSHVVIKCLNLTDHSSCTLNYHPDPAFKCATKPKQYGDNDPELGNWSHLGIHAQDSNDVTLQDLDIHGFADQGIQAGRNSNWTIIRVTIAGNGNVGWNGDLGGNNHTSSNSGTLTFTDLVVKWNGCAEEYPQVGKFVRCYGQEQGGYGDGLGAAWTGGDWVFTRPKFYGNTQDGLDLLYANGTGSIKVDHGYFARNVGNDLKTSGNATITNSVFIAQCDVFVGTTQPIAPNPCRAGGGEFSNTTGPNQTVTFAYNTVVGDAGCLFGGDASTDATDVYDINNNIFLGKPKWNGDGLTCLGWFGSPAPATIKYTNNIIWNVKRDQCPGTSVCKNPLLENESLEKFDPTPRSRSPAVGAAKPPPSLARTSHAQRNIGAIQGTADWKAMKP